MKYFVSIFLFAFMMQPSILHAEPVGDSMDICLCRNVLARTLCKQPQDLKYIDEYQTSNTYSFTVFYAKTETRFVCLVTDTEIRIQGKAWQPIMRTIPLDFESNHFCGLVNYSVPECPYEKPIICCSEKSVKQEKEDKAYDFWNRPIPEILEDEIRLREMQENAPTE